jgi:putative transposase
MRTIKIRLFPTVEQEHLMNKHIGCSRFIWNWGLAYQKEQYASTGKKLSCFDLIKQLTPLKKIPEYTWLNEVSNATLQTVLQDLDKAYTSFFKGAGFPKFKSKKRSKRVYPLRSDCVSIEEGFVKIAKLGKVAIKTTPNLTKIYNPRITRTPNNKWILTVSYERENQAPALTDKSMGIDLGVKSLATVAFDDEMLTYGNINKTANVRKLEKKRERLQRSISRKYVQNRSYSKSKHILKSEQQLRELNYHLSNIRKDYIHKTTHELTSLLPRAVVMEDLNVSGMMKNRHLSKAIQEQCLYKFIRQMKYKCEDAGIEFKQVDKFYPSSKKCSHCGEIKQDLKLKDRTYVCPHCGFSIDRDYNAAINLRNCA